MNTEEQNNVIDSLVMRVLRATAFENCGDVWWRVDGEYAPITIFVDCNDLFYWGTADCEVVNAENIDILEKSYKDSETNGGALFCCRVRKMRPQKPCYKSFDEKDKPLFDACGPERNE